MSEILDIRSGVRGEEIIDGRVVAPIWRLGVNHGRVVYNIATIFDNYLKGKESTPFAYGTELYLDDKNRFLPDFMVVCDPDKIEVNGVHGTPDLVVEVLTNNSIMEDRRYKMEAYAKSGVPEYWIVDDVSKSVEIYRLQEGRYRLYDLYPTFEDWEVEQMNEKERAEMVRTHFKCGLFDDLDIAMDDVFYRTIEDSR